MKLNNIRLLVSDFDKMFLFYRDILSFEVIWGNVGENYAQFKAGDSADLSIFSKALMAEAVGTSALPNEVSAQDNVALVFSVENIDNLYGTLIAKEIKFINKPTDMPDWGIKAAHLRDPEGNLLELYMDLPKEKISDKLKEDFDKYAK